MSYCRLCAEPKSDDDLCASINDLKFNFLEKLIACCQWDTYPLNPELPEHICFLCSERLEKSWLFSVCVSEAQRKLLQLLSDGELTIGTEEAVDGDRGLLDDNLGDIFVETIPIPEFKSDSTEELVAEPDAADELIGSTIEPTDDKIIICEICKKAFTTTYNLTVHKRTHTNERPYVCWNENCDKQFKSSSNLNQHLRKVHGKLPYTQRPHEIVASEVIEKLVEEPKIGKVERSPETEHFNETCDICGRKFRLKCTLKAHRTIHFPERKFECTLCHRAFKRMKLLRVHMRTHTQFPSIPCPICGKLFRRNCQRDAHIKERHGVPAPKREKKPPAPPKKPLKKFTCELCGLSFTQKGGLSTHMTVHSDNRPFKCDICNLGFKRKRTMQDHRKTHTHSHEFKCDQDGCDKAFRKKISLIRHLEYHSGSICRPFICDFCGKGFRLNANLVEHQRIHTGEKPYSCEFKPCSQTFRTMSSFYSHLKKEHGVSIMARKLEQQARATELTQVPSISPQFH